MKLNLEHRVLEKRENERLGLQRIKLSTVNAYTKRVVAMRCNVRDGSKRLGRQHDLVRDERVLLDLAVDIAGRDMVADLESEERGVKCVMERGVS